MRVPDERLLAQWGQGDTEAFAQLVRRHQNAVFAIAYAITGEREAGEDLTQMCFVEAFQRLRELRDGRRLGPWLHAIARNRAHDWLREQSRAPAPLGDPTQLDDCPSGVFPAGPEAALLDDERDAAIRRAVNSLPREYREVVVLHYVGELRHAETARALGISVSAVKMRWHRARKMLGERLSGWAPEGAERTRDELPAS